MAQDPTVDLSPGARLLAEAAAARQKDARHPELNLHHWLLAAVERHGPMAESLARGLAAADLRRYLHDRLAKGEVGAALPQETVLAEAGKRARARSKAQVSERDIVAVVLAAAGYTVADGPAGVAPSAAAAVSAPTLPAATVAAGGPATTPALASSETEPVPAAPPPAADAGSLLPGLTASASASRAFRPTPILERFGRDLTREGAEGKLAPVVGRQDEVALVVETLCRRTKRNPVLVGPAGVGKTAIVEGLAQRIARGEVPEVLKGSRVWALQPAVLVAGSELMGEIEKRMTALIAEASQDGILLFIDEVHSIVGSGGAAGRSDIASLLKPSLARGDFACIAATTDDEYRRFIETDAALERRFQPIRVQELSEAQTLEVLQALRDELRRLRGVDVGDEVLRRLVDFAARNMKNRYFPDKGVDLLEQCVAFAVAQGRKSLEVADAATVAQRLVGMPLDAGERVRALAGRLSERALLVAGDAEELVNRLEVTLRGLDVRPSRPNAIVLLAGDAAEHGGALAETIAETLLGGEQRVVTIDFSRFTHHTDVTLLLGAPPGYIGYSDALAIHRVAQMPWCVLRCESVDACHPSVREVLTLAFEEGFFTDSRGRRVFLSDTVVLLTAGVRPETEKVMGFASGGRAPAAADLRTLAAEVLGAGLVAQCDLVVSEVPSEKDAGGRRLADDLLGELKDRYRQHGLELRWEPGVVDWLLAESAGGGRRDWERLLDQRLSPLLVPHLQGAEARTLLVTCAQGTLRVQAGS